MKSGETGALAHVSGRNRERKGLEAIFSSQESGSRREIRTGTAGVLVGLILSILGILPTNNEPWLGSSTNAIYSSLAFGSVGVLLLICGSGTIVFAVSRRESNPSQLGGQSKAGVLEDVVGRREPQRMFGPSSRVGVVAFVQSLVLVVSYSGFVQEYESNPTMQTWVRSNFSVAQSVLNWQGVLVLSVSLGVLLLQFLPGRFFFEEQSTARY